MNFKLRNIVAATLAGTFLMGFGASALADSTFDLVNALVSKGVLTEEEALPLLKGREADIAAADKKVAKKAKIGISDAIDNAKLYGDIRARYEMRNGSDSNVKGNSDQERNRARYKITFGVKTAADDFYTDLAFAMGAGGRSDNATFGNAKTNGGNEKETLFVKRAMIGWNATDWLTVEAGRVNNPLFTQAMVWDGDLTFEGLVEKMKFEFTPDTSMFVTGVQSQYSGDSRDYNYKADQETNEMFATQVGVEQKFNDNIKGKAAVTYTAFSNSNKDLSTAKLSTIEVPMELGFKTEGTLAYKAFGDYAFNLDASDRCKALVGAATCNKFGDEEDAWLVGGEIKSVQDPKGKASTKGDWKAKIWYQSVGAFALDPNAVDSDFMDSAVNMDGVVFKGEYNVRDNVFFNFAAGYGDIKNSNYRTFSKLYTTATGDIGAAKLDNYSLYQFDMTYKF